MLEIYFGTRKDTVSNPPIFFNYNVNPRLLLGDKEIQQMILDIDKTVLTDNGQWATDKSCTSYYGMEGHFR